MDGRDGELAVFDLLRQRLDETGVGATVWVEGDAGMGKSAFVAALSARSAIPVLVSSPAEATGRLETLCAEGPVVLITEDLHLADDEALLAWSQLSRTASLLPVLLVGTSSPRPYRERLSQLREAVRKRDGVLITLSPLSDADLVAVAARYLGEPPEPELIRCLSAIRGNPGVALAMLGELGRRRDGASAESESESAAILETHACRDLSDTHRTVLHQAALAPARFDIADVAQAAGIGAPAVAAALSHATDLGILRAEGEHLAFRHEVLRDACAQTYSAAERHEYHRAAATRLLAVGARPRAIAHHIRGAGTLPPEAARWRDALPQSTLLSDPKLFSDVLRMAPKDPRADDPHLRAWRAIAHVAEGELAAARAEIDDLSPLQDSPLAAAAVAHALVRTGRGREIWPRLHAIRDALDPLAESLDEAHELRALLHADLLELLPQVGLAPAETTRPGWETAAMRAETARNLDEALALRRQGFADALAKPPTKLHGVEHLIRLCLATGADTASVIEACQRVADVEALAAQIAIADSARAIVARDISDLSAAAEELARCGAVAQQAFALEEAAVCQAEGGDRTAAARTLRQAVRCYATLDDAAWDITRADARLASHGIARRASAARPDSGWAALTPAESRVVRLVARGLTNRAIAQELFLSQNTVQTHLARIRGKLGLRSRLEIARAAGFRADGDPAVGSARGSSRPAPP